MTREEKIKAAKEAYEAVRVPAWAAYEAAVASATDDPAEAAGEEGVPLTREGQLERALREVVGHLATSRLRHGGESAEIVRADRVAREALAALTDPTMPPGVVPGPTGATTGETHEERTTPTKCYSCGKPVEASRECYVSPVCYACLPPPEPLVEE